MRLTDSERFWVWMRRNEYGNRDAAAILGVTPNRITEWVGGKREDVPTAVLEGAVGPWELSAVVRRRSGLTCGEVARQMGISKVSLLKRERGKGRWSEMWGWWNDNYPELCR